MHLFQFQLLAIALATSVACCLPGIFLMLRGVALMSDAISHAILPGIVIMFLLLKNIESPFLIIGAAAAGMMTVILTESIIQSQRLKKDAAIGLVFPLFFSTGIILISYYARTLHLDIDMVLLGELAFAPFNRLTIGSIDCGPWALWNMMLLVVINSSLVWLFYKELQLTIFDPTLAHILGYSSCALYYGLMLMSSITIVGAFNVVGSIVVVALILAPAAGASLITQKLKRLIAIAVAIALISSLLGYGVAFMADVSIAGAIATMSGLIFLIIFIFAPHKGLLANFLYDRLQNQTLALEIIKTHRAQKCCTDLAQTARHLGWSFSYLKKIVVVEQKKF